MKTLFHRNMKNASLYSVILFFLTTACLILGSSTNKPKNDSSIQLPSETPFALTSNGSHIELTQPPSDLLGGDYIVFRLVDFNDPSKSIIQYLKADRSGKPQNLWNKHGILDMDWSHDGQKIVYKFQFELFFTDIANSFDTQITHEYDNVVSPDQPNMSPSGERVAYNFALSTSKCTQESTLIVINTDGTNRQIISEMASCNGVDWSPDGLQLVYAINVHQNARLYIFNTQSGKSQQITPKVVEQFDTAPAWSPDGSTIAFYRNTNPPSNSGLYFIDKDGTNERRVVDGIGISSLSWSPDGSKLAFLLGEINSQIYTINADGSNLAQITGFKGVISDYAWSPDQEQIAVSVINSGDTDLYVVNIDGLAYEPIANKKNFGEYLIGWLP